MVPSVGVVLVRAMLRLWVRISSSLFLSTLNLRGLCVFCPGSKTVKQPFCTRWALFSSKDLHFSGSGPTFVLFSCLSIVFSINCCFYLPFFKSLFFFFYIKWLVIKKGDIEIKMKQTAAAALICPRTKWINMIRAWSIQSFLLMCTGVSVIYAN